MKRYLKLIDKKIIKYNNENSKYYNKPEEEKKIFISNSVRNNEKQILDSLISFSNFHLYKN